ncbi:MAG: response regulator [Verrucomicrobiota bacterium]
MTALIFVVDDNPELGKMAEMILESEGYRCRVFSSPQEVLSVLHEGAPFPDLLLTDYDMGPTNGLQLVENCRHTMPHLKAILLSGTINAETVLRNSIKVNHFLPKPYQSKDLIRLVKATLKE